MRKLPILFTLCLMWVMPLCAQTQNMIITNGGWFSITSVDQLAVTNDLSGDTNDLEQVQENFIPMTSPTPPLVAEIVTPDIQALADGLQHDPLRIFNYVHDHIQYILYFGSVKGAQLTLLEKTGNDFDQCALLVALLRASGYTNTANNVGYQFGWMVLPYDNPDGSGNDIHHWLGLSVTNSNWSTTTTYLDDLFVTQRSYPIVADNLGNNIYGVQRVWVTLSIGGTNYYLDPSFKITKPIPGIDLGTATGCNSNTLWNLAGGNDVGSFSGNFYATNLNETQLRGTLAGYTTNLLAYIQNNCPNASGEQVLGGQYIVPSTNMTLSQSLLFATTNLNGTMPVTNWVNQPTNMMSYFSFNYLGTTYTWLTPQLQGQRLSLTVSSTGSAQLWQEEKLLATKSSGGGSGQFSATLGLSNPGVKGKWNTTNNTFIPGSYLFTYQSYCSKANADYALIYAFSPDWSRLQGRQKELELYRQQNSDTSWQVVTETLNVMGLNWLTQTEYINRMLAQETGVLPMYYGRLGFAAQESGFGYYISVGLQVPGPESAYGLGDHRVEFWSLLWGFFASAEEHGIIEQLQDKNLVGASTVKLLQLANASHQAVYMANKTNWSSIEGHLSGYNSTAMSQITYWLDNGYTELLPKEGNMEVNGSGSWEGFGILAGSPGGEQMLIGDTAGLHDGGFDSDPDATIDPAFIDYSDYSQPLYFDSAPVSVPHFTGADPVNMADGTFQIQTTDLSVGQTEPRGFNFTRYYNSSRRSSNLVGMSPGWLHNYFLNAAPVSAPQAGLGGTTPAQMASMLVATTSAKNFFDPDHPDPKNWLTTILIIKWGIDQITGNAVSVNMGQDTVQFIQQPDGSFTPPANVKMALWQTNSAYQLQERNGRTFQFNAAGWATNILDQYNRNLTLAYNSSNWVTTITDWTNRTLTFNYSSSSPKQLLSVADSTGRTAKLGYSSASAHDLTSVADPENGTNTFLYDTNHQIVATWDALNQLVVSNIFDVQGHVTTQYTQGDTNKQWNIYWSGWETVEQDPAGGQRHFVYDDHTRLIQQRDALGNLTQTFYDGQDHIVMTVSPMNETNQSVYDGNQNVVATIDPLGYSNQFFYDAQNNLISMVDQRGNTNHFGYNSQFSLTGTTNGAGDWVAFSYNTDGTLASRTDLGGTTMYTYDSLGQLKQIAYPGSLGNEGFLNGTNGDVLSHTNGRGFVTSFQYNNRRQLTNTVAPTNLTTKVAYDAVGNQKSVTDARGFTMTSFWSSTRHQTGTVFPLTPQGTPTSTNYYDSRDWLVQSINNPGSAVSATTTRTNDSAGRQLSITDPLLRTTWFGYDNDGRQTSATNAAQQVTRQTFDARGQSLQITDPALHTVLSSFDGAGNQTILTNRRSKVWHFAYDAANRQSSCTTPLGRNSSSVFDNRGLLRTNTDPMLQQTVFTYDAKGRLSTRADAVATTDLHYDANNNLTNVTESTAGCNWTYDAYDRVSSSQDANGNLIKYQYDANGNLSILTYPGGKTVSYGYDSLNRLTNVTDWANRVTTISYDLASRVKTITRPNNTLRSINYDADGEITNIVEKTSNNYPLAFFTLGWTNSGRIAWEFAAPLPQNNSVPSRTMTYDDDNRISAFNGSTILYDNNGNMTNGPLLGSGLIAYAYDSRNRLEAAGGAGYGYDSTGNRTSMTNGTNAVWFVVSPVASLPQALIRTKADGSETFYVYGPGLLYEANFDSSGSELNTRTYHYDYRGSTVALTDGSGLPTDRIQYSPYGSTLFHAGTTDTPFLYNGRYGVMTDPNGLLYMQARYYNPYLSRFINPDPSGFGGGLNQYAFANGDPISMTDPFGLGAVEAATGGSWLHDIWTGLGIDDSMAATTRREEAVTGIADAGTFGMVNDAFSVGSGLYDRFSGQGSGLGYNMNGGLTTSQDQVASAAMFGMALIPGDDLEAGISRLVVDIADAATERPVAYSVAFETQLAPQEFGISSRRQFQIANNALQAEREVNPELADLVPAPEGWGQAPDGWIWHHATFDQANRRFGVLQLVPEEQHTPGSPYWSLLHAGNFGGYWQWAVPAGAPPR